MIIKTSQENSKAYEMIQMLQFMKQRKIPLLENVYRPSSTSYFHFIKELRDHPSLWHLLSAEDRDLLENTDIGQMAVVDEATGEEGPLDYPMFTKSPVINTLTEQNKDNVELNKPKRGGPKKYYVYVRDPKTGNVRKITFGDTSGLKVKINDPAARKSFAARHRCDQQDDKMSAAYWSCRLPRYAKALGLQVDNPNTWW